MPKMIFGKINNKFKKAVLFGGLFLGILFVLFYLVNLDVDPEQTFPQASSSAGFIVDGEIKKRISSNEISLAGFSDWASANGLVGENIYDGDPDKDGLANYLEFVHLTDPNMADTDKDGYSDLAEIRNGYDPDDEGSSRLMTFLQIDKINVSAPVVWSDSEIEKEMQKDLEKGVAHFAKTASPGQIGNMIISGHSSNYIWAKGDYNHIFKNLEDVEIGDIVTIRTVQQNGRVIVYKYKVSEKFIAAPDDERIFTQTKNPTLTLSTCWPVGTTLKRTIVKAELVK